MRDNTFKTEEQPQQKPSSFNTPNIFENVGITLLIISAFMFLAYMGYLGYNSAIEKEVTSTPIYVSPTPIYKSEYELECIDRYGYKISNQINITTISELEPPCNPDGPNKINLTNYGLDFSDTVTCDIVNCNSIRVGGI